MGFQVTKLSYQTEPLSTKGYTDLSITTKIQVDWNKKISVSST